jgi:peptidoglycan biosynthesis protein MviN/MurJ (putative lipid II flippase)
LPIGFVIAALGPIVLGALVEERSQDLRRLAQRAVGQLRAVGAGAVPLAFLTAAAAPILVELVYQSGEFGATSTELTTDALDGLVIGIAPIATTLVLFRMLQAVAPMRATVVISTAAMSLNFALSVVGAVWLGLFGVTLATGLVGVVTVGLQVSVLADQFGRRWLQPLVRAAAPAAVSCAICLVVVGASQADQLDDLQRAAVLSALTILSGFLLLRR